MTTIKTTRTVGRLMAETLAAHDIDLLYCVPGESYLGLTNALNEVPSIRLIVCRHEGGAGFMAAADGRMRDRAGVCVVSRGPGLSNAMVALHTAYHDATPLVMIVGQVERRDFGRMALQEQNYSRLLSDITKAVIEVNEPVMAAEALARAFHLAESGTPGPVAVIVPEDLFDAETDAPIGLPRALPRSGPTPADLDRLAGMLIRAERPLILVGGTLRGEGVSADLARLAESWGLPICPTHRRPHLFASDHPNYGGYMGIRVPADLLNEMKKADLLIALGERLSDSISQSYTFPTAPEPQIPLVHIWPDPNEIGRVWRADLPMACEPHEVIRALLARKAPAVTEARQSWVRTLHTTHRRLMEPVWEPTEDGVNFAAVVAEIAKNLPENAAITSDAGNFSSFIHRYMPFRPGQVFLSSIVGAMGSGVPMAVAAALRRPGKQAIAFLGDGGAMMTGNELATARQYGVNPILVISDNARYGTITMHHDMRYPGRPFEEATRLTNPDFAAWAETFGAEGITITEEGEVAQAIGRAFTAAKDRPVVIHVKSSAIQMSAWRRYQPKEALPA